MKKVCNFAKDKEDKPMDSIFFLFNRREEDTRQTIESVLKGGGIDRVVVFQSMGGEDCSELEKLDNVEVLEVEDQFFTGNVLRKVNTYKARYKFLYTKSEPLLAGYMMAARMKAAVDASGMFSRNRDNAMLVYADHYEVRNGQTLSHPLNDWQCGSVRNDFDFGSVLLLVGKIKESDYKYAALYHAWLYAKEKVHIPEPLYTEQESDLRKSGQKQFDYVNPAQRDVQKEMEQAFTAWLKDKNEHRGFASECEGIDLRITPEMLRRANVDMEWANGVEASVIIPVRNRERTIGDAIHSALSQEADFSFNVIVIDNHSTDNTSAVIENMARQDKRVVHLVPAREDLGIGGCWDLAVRDDRCGIFAVQLDSDDLYSSPQTLRKIVDKFKETKAAMVIGSYQLVDFRLNPLPPGLIDHKEWTDLNGPNNALRINGLGAPRAFFTPVVREVGFSNVSYGEDYAVGLRISAQYRIGRIYESLYLCRRWEGNSDAALSQERVNRNNAYKDWIRTQELGHRAALISEGLDAGVVERLYEKQLAVWPQVKGRFMDLESKVERKSLTEDNDEMPMLVAQYNPARVRSTAAKVDKQSINERPCFLCQDLQPKEQLHYNYHNRYQLCINPYPILPRHFTFSSCAHTPQLMAGHYQDMDDLARRLRGYVVFYNGAQCGASAPDHFHFQIGKADEVPLVHPTYDCEMVAPDISVATEYPCPVFICDNVAAAKRVIDALPVVEGEKEPRFNLLGFNSWEFDKLERSEDIGNHAMYIVIPRSKHRPDCYFKQGDEQFYISPGAVDMAGLLITVREEDYKRLTFSVAYSILKEVGLSQREYEAVVAKIKKKR